MCASSLYVHAQYSYAILHTQTEEVIIRTRRQIFADEDFQLVHMQRGGHPKPYVPQPGQTQRRKQVVHDSPVNGVCTVLRMDGEGERDLLQVSNINLGYHHRKICNDGVGLAVVKAMAVSGEIFECD